MRHGPGGLVWCGMSERGGGYVIFAVFILAIMSLMNSVAGIAHNREAERWGTHCATLDAIAVQTPEGWTCITASVIPADSASTHIGYDALTGSTQ